MKTTPPPHEGSNYHARTKRPDDEGTFVAPRRSPPHLHDDHIGTIGFYSGSEVTRS